ncbi:hypothetical protein KMP13_11780 [Epibacterium ulvae]|uniref:hypothetical protein n=1 Tax=Epibacterium ulvae TaxID=1156985 RepID=UPI001BFCCCF2|nr:hypothetical protein [Epibacterium ulvae]MBT8154567.1 hypothetical protein [Epibacterium ulvae]
MLGLRLAVTAVLFQQPFAALTRLLRNQDGTLTVQSLDAPSMRTTRTQDGTVTVEN